MKESKCTLCRKDAATKGGLHQRDNSRFWWHSSCENLMFKILIFLILMIYAFIFYLILTGNIIGVISSNIILGILLYLRIKRKKENG